MQEHLKNVPRLLGALLLCQLLASCGGGSGSENARNDQPVSLDTVGLTCNVIDKVSRLPVAGADVNYQAGAAEFATQTDAAGNCELVMPATEVAGVPYPAASVKKAEYEPQTMLFEKLQGGRNYHQNVELEPLAANVSIPVGGETVMHLGDDLFEGTANSQFQKKSDGAEVTFVIADWAAKVREGYTKATVYLDAKGWQTNICNNLVGLSGDLGTVTLAGGTSPPGGYWGGGKQVPFEFSVAQVGTQTAEVRVISGGCNGTTDLDDFEINRIRVYFR
jgi:hypothetical protein